MNRIVFGVVLILTVQSLGCGVKGDPLPPKDAPRLGRGNPTYINAVKSIDFESQEVERDSSEESDEDE